MAAIETMSNMEKVVLVKTLGLLVLHDAGLPLEVENLQKLVKASGFTYDQTIASLLCKSLQSMDIKTLFNKVGSTAPSASSPQTGHVTKGNETVTKEAKEEEQEEEEEEDMGFSLFD